MYPIYNAILAAFESQKTLFTKNHLKPPFIDVFLGQPSDPEAFEFVTPAIFIDYSIDWRNCVLTIEAHVVDDPGEETNNHNPKRDQGLDHLRYLAICRHIINGVSAYGTKKLRPSTERPVTTDYFQYHQQNFETLIDDLIDLLLIDVPLTTSPPNSISIEVMS